ncbi:hypothetical protein MKEN_00929500 [Mycena kentingensis (nom. inval.)]|nr:hypothetical protein MKEN_00929500 [Mycena kentingensis (nom. inval.)]
MDINITPTFLFDIPTLERALTLYDALTTRHKLKCVCDSDSTRELPELPELEPRPPYKEELAGSRRARTRRLPRLEKVVFVPRLHEWVVQFVRGKLAKRNALEQVGMAGKLGRVWVAGADIANVCGVRGGDLGEVEFRVRLTVATMLCVAFNRVEGRARAEEETTTNNADADADAKDQQLPYIQVSSVETPIPDARVLALGEFVLQVMYPMAVGRRFVYGLFGERVGLLRARPDATGFVLDFVHPVDLEEDMPLEVETLVGLWMHLHASPPGVPKPKKTKKNARAKKTEEKTTTFVFGGVSSEEYVFFGMKDVDPENKNVLYVSHCLQSFPLDGSVSPTVDASMPTKLETEEKDGDAQYGLMAMFCWVWVANMREVHAEFFEYVKGKMESGEGLCVV